MPCVTAVYVIHVSFSKISCVPYLILCCSFSLPLLVCRKFRLSVPCLTAWPPTATVRVKQLPQLFSMVVAVLPVVVDGARTGNGQVGAVCRLHPVVERFSPCAVFRSTYCLLGSKLACKSLLRSWISMVQRSTAQVVSLLCEA